MANRNFFFKLAPPRATFIDDMTKEEEALMYEHFAYVKEQMESGKVLLFGPVRDPAGAFGLAILEVADEAEARIFGENDPTVRAGLCRFEFHPMRVTRR
jgi:uncharacterized protein